MHVNILTAWTKRKIQKKNKTYLEKHSFTFCHIAVLTILVQLLIYSFSSIAVLVCTKGVCEGACLFDGWATHQPFFSHQHEGLLQSVMGFMSSKSTRRGWWYKHRKTLKKKHNLLAHLGCIYTFLSIHSCWVFLKSEVNTWQLDLCVGILMFVQKNEGGVKFCLFCCIDSSSKAYHREGDTEMLSDTLSSNHVTGQWVVANGRAAQHHIEQQPPTPASYWYSYKSGCLVTASVCESRARVEEETWGIAMVT